MLLKEQVVVVTGASKGIGAEMARHFAAEGARVAALARSADALESLADEISGAGGHCLGIACDVADPQSVAGAFKEVDQTFGAVGVLVNNAGVIDPISRLDASDPVEWGRAIDINLKGVYYCARAALPGMVSSHRGVIINISSGAALNALEGWSHYCASKAGVLALTRCLHKEYAGSGVRTVGLSPGTVATDMQVAIRASGVNPVSQLDPDIHIPPAWVAQTAAWLCTDEARRFDGGDFTLKTDEERALVGLPPVGTRG